MKTGDAVKVYPRGEPDKATDASIVIISTNQQSIVVGFGDKPPFQIGFNSGNWTLHPEHGIIMLASREDDGTFTEVFGGRSFQIEARVVE